MDDATLFDYKLNCIELPENIDFHKLLAYKFNPKLADLVNKYYSHSLESRRTLESWINEYDGARIHILYRVDDKVFENTIIDWLFNLRDMFIHQKIDINSLRRYIADIAVLTAHRNPNLSKDIIDLLDILGCKLSIKSKERVLISEEDALRMLKNLEATFGARSGEVVRVSLKVFKGGKPAKGVILEVSNIIQEEGEIKERKFKVETDRNGKAIIPVPKFSILKVKVGKIEKTVIVGNKDTSIEFKLKGYGLIHASIIIALIALLIALYFLLTK